MIKHIVMMKFKPTVTGAEADKLKQALDGLPALIPEIKEFLCGHDVLRSERSWDFALVSSFDDIDALNRYQVNHDHQVVAQKARAMCDHIVIVDFEFAP